MAFTPVKIPFWVKKIFPSYVWHINTQARELYLTFDDGPTPEITDWVLNTLGQYNAKATFFCIGKNIEQHPDIFKRIISKGHSIGNHTQNHVKGWKTSSAEYINSVKQTELAINNNTEPNHLSPLLFRPPYGRIKKDQGKQLIQLGYKIIMWDILSVDWDKSITPEKCCLNVINNSRKGSIIVFHDSIKASINMKYALPKVLEHFNGLGYSFKAIT